MKYILTEIRNNTSSLWFAIIWSLLLFFLYFGGDGFLPEKYFWDSQLLLAFAEGGGGEYLEDGSYYYTALLFSLFGPALGVFNLSVALLLIFFSAYYVKKIEDFYLASFLLLPHIVLGMSRPQKELFVTILTLVVIYFAFKLNERVRLVFVIVLTYCAYAIVRNYYVLIIGLFLMFYFSWTKIKIEGFLSLLAVMLVVLAFAPPSIFESLQGTRDIFNSLRPPGGEGNETIYFNPYTPDSLFNFFANYLSALTFFIFPIFYHQSISALYLQLFMFIVFFYMHKAVRFSRGNMVESNVYTNSVVKIMMFLFASHIIVLLLFEPDLGSFMRHIASVAVFLLPIKKIFDEESIN
jgi:hypothetical protein